jgi:sporulation and spore germination protein
VRRALVALGVIVAAGALGWAIFWWLPGLISPQQATRGGVQPADAPAGNGRTIRATLFYANETGDGLVGVEREVPQADDTAEQARNILDRQFEAAPAPLLQVVPEATRVRTVFLITGGTAYVDLTGEVASTHPGGSLDELLTVYAIVDALTVNLPSVTSVQILIDGKEVDTLAGHVDLRRPLPANRTLIRPPAS